MEWSIFSPAEWSIFTPPLTWYHVAFTYSASGSLIGYVNGAQDSSTSASSHGLVQNLGTSAVLANSYYGSRNWNGLVDEARISNVARSAGWIATEYNNQSSPSTFYSLATAEAVVAAPTFSPVAGLYSSSQTVSISTTTPGASINYTTDGSIPTSSTGTVYTGSITVSSTTTIRAIAYLPSAASSVASATFTIGGSSAWYDLSWGYRKPVTVNYTQVSGSTNLTNFPMLVSVTDPNLASTDNGGQVGSSDGNDILFTASDGLTKLNHEIESYDSATGQLVAWVQIPTLSVSANTTVYIYYGNAAASNQQNPTGVWDSNYLGVWHLAATTMTDSTSNHWNGGSTGSTTTTGQIGGGLSLSGTSSYLSVPSSSMNLSGGFTYGVWAYPTAVQNDAKFMDFGNGAPSNNIDFDRSGTTNTLEFSFYNGTSAVVTVDNTSAIALNTWQYFVVTVNASNVVSVYSNGSLLSTTTASQAIPTITRTNNYFGGSNWSTDSDFEGYMDELRISNIARSAGWIGTEYNNQSSPSTFYSVGAAQTP